MRGRGGFIVAPGAVRADGRRWMEPEDGPGLVTAFLGNTVPQIPDWLVGLIRQSHRSDHCEKVAPAAPLFPSPAGARERAYAARALENEQAEVARAQSGDRNNTLNKAAFALGRMAGAGWLEPEVIRSELFQAAQACGLVQDDGVTSVEATIASGLTSGIREPHPGLLERSFGTIGSFGTGSEAEIAWAEPDLSYRGTGPSPAVSFPTDLLGPFWGQWCEAQAKARFVPVDYLAAGLLAGASALIGNARWALANPEWKEPPHLWMAIVGAPSAGKSPALDPVLDMLRQVEREAIEATAPAREAYTEAAELAKAHAAEWQRQVRQALQDGKAPPPRPPEANEPEPVPLPRIVVGDTTPERLCTILQDNPRGLLLQRDELAGWLGSFGRYSSDAGGERALWLEAYGGRAYTIDRQKSQEPVVIPHLAVAVLGGIQPDKLPMITGGADDGFAARILWSWPEPTSGFRLNREEVDSTLQLEAFRRLSRLGLTQDENGAARPSYVPLSDAAAAQFERYVAEVKEQARAAYGPLAGALGKAPGHVLRLALVLEYLAWSGVMFAPEPTRIGEAAMLTAIGLVDGYSLPMAKRVFGAAALPEEEQAATELARWIAASRPTRFNARKTRREIGGRLREAAAMRRACEVLTDAGWIRPVGRSPEGPTGRTALNYEVNPTLLGEAQVHERVAC